MDTNIEANASANTIANTQTHTHSIDSCHLQWQPCSRLPPCPEAVSQWQYVQCVKPTWVLWCHTYSMNMQIIDDMSMSINGNIHYQNNNLDLEGGNVCSAWVCQTACQQMSESLISCELFKVLNPSILPSSLLPTYLPTYLHTYLPSSLSSFLPFFTSYCLPPSYLLLCFLPRWLTIFFASLLYPLNPCFSYLSNYLSLLPTHLRCSSSSYLSPTFPLLTCVMPHLCHTLHGHKHRSKRISKHNSKHTNTHTQHR